MRKVILSVHEEGYSRNASCALNLISTILFQRIVRFIDIGGIVDPHCLCFLFIFSAPKN
jgi:hypothetical protein